MHFTLHSNSSTASGSKKSFFGLSLGNNDLQDSGVTSPRSIHGPHNDSDAHLNPEHSHSPPGTPSHPQDKETHHTMQPLKRFFRPSLRKNSTARSNSSSASASTSTLNLSKHGNDPFDDDGILAQKYGRMGKILGSGAGGSVRLLTRPSDGVTYAVKEFRPRRSGEPMKEYAKKCTAEFCIGSTLHHPNIIETLDIAHEGEHYYEVMEYCPVDFFAVVMSGHMTRSEINCCFRQITEGVSYLHKMGIAHRDLKLDNCVISKDGIVKLIDFGSAAVFKYPYEEGFVKAQGVCGSDPYLAPEVLNYVKYDPRPVDVWSIAIIYCCMTLKRFPWKVPRPSDPSFRLYCLPDDKPHDYSQAAKIHAELIRRRKEERLRREQEMKLKEQEKVEKITEVLDATHIRGEEYNPQPSAISQQKDDSSESVIYVRAITPNDTTIKTQYIPHQGPEHHRQNSNDHQKHHQQQSVSHPPSQTHTIHGPYRLMRLLPHAARPLLSRMLALEPRDRASIEDMFNDDWFSGISQCTVEKGRLIRGPGHIHTEVKEEDAHLEGYKEKEKRRS